MTTISDAASSGDRKRTLEAMRDKLARDMDEAPPAVVAQIAGRLAAILAELDDLGGAGEVSAFDELAKRRSHRIATPSDRPPADGSGKQRGA